MKLGIFTDPHYLTENFNQYTAGYYKSLDKIKEALKFFCDEKCDMVICLGDVIDTEKTHEKEVENLKEVIAELDKYDMKISIVMGNHDAFTFEVDEYYKLIGEKYRPENFFSDGLNFIFVDACYFKNGTHYMPGDTAWEDTFYPHTKKLKETLSEAKGDTYIFMHQNIDPEIDDADYILANAEEIRQILEDSGKVKAVFQGHYHWGKETLHNNIRYVSFKAMSDYDDAYCIEIL